jgi:hypothetical protein
MKVTRGWIVAALGLMALAGSASGASVDDGRSLAFDADEARLEMTAEPKKGAEKQPAGESGEAGGDAVSQPGEARAAFLKPGRWWGGVIGGYARALNEDSNDFNLAFTLSTFLIDRFEFMMEFGGWYFDQEGDDAGGLNWNLIFRVHVFAFGERDKWTIFADAGAGLLGTTDNVPDGGTGFNFTPRAGVGFTHRLFESENRLVVGVRWHHISNARINGDERNPGRDGINVYAGVEFPF